MKKTILKWTFIILTILINSFIIFNALLPSDNSTEVASPIVVMAANITNFFEPESISTNPIPPDFSNFIRKAIGHFGLFCIDGIATYLAFYFSINKKFRYSLLFSILLGLFMSIGSELLQLIPKGRSCEILDMSIDFLGFIIGSVVTFLITLLIRRIKHE